jgi:chromosome segregation ATPase
MKTYHLFIFMMIASATLLSCGSGSRRAEIDARKAALRHKQDSTLLAAQQELAVVDSTLEAVKREYTAMEAVVGQHRAELKATEQELTDLAQLRMRRDSLQVQWETLGAKIRYIRKKQSEMH